MLPENRHEKFSLKKEFKRKCQEESFQSDRFDKRNAALCHGTLETSETLYLPCYSQEGGPLLLTVVSAILRLGSSIERD